MTAIARTKLGTFLNSTNGKIFTANFLKKDGSLRSMNCRRGVHAYQKGGINRTVKLDNAYITVFDLKAHDYRTLNLDTVQTVKFKREIYKIID